MKIDERYFLEHRLNYLKLVLKLTNLRLKGDTPPQKLIQQAHEAGLRACISEQELRNL